MPPPAPVARGVVLERDPEAAGGEFSIRLDNCEVLRYRFDAHTSVERQAYPIDVPRLRPGERVEVLSDTVPGSLVPYARTVRTIGPVLRAALPAARRRLAWSLASEAYAAHDADAASSGYFSGDPLFGRGDPTFSGIIDYLAHGRLVLHTRQGERTILLRDDTRYLANGDFATSSALSPNLRVFVRAGRNLYDEFEGYQVVWGEILEPH